MSENLTRIGANSGPPPEDIAILKLTERQISSSVPFGALDLVFDGLLEIGAIGPAPSVPGVGEPVSPPVPGNTEPPGLPPLPDGLSSPGLPVP